MIIIYQGLTVLTRLNGNLKDFKENPTSWYPDWEPSLTASDTEFEYPKVVDGVTIGMEPDEAKIQGLKPLEEGEVIREGTLVQVPKPEEKPTHKVTWETPNWVEVPNYDSYLQNLKQQIIQLTSELAQTRMAGFEDLELANKLAVITEEHKRVAHEYSTLQ